MELTHDGILGSRLRIWQPVTGYRVAIDPIFLAASIPAQAGDSILDIGTGVGAAALCLAKRVPGCYVVGLELQRDMVRLAAQNVEENGLREYVEVLYGDLQQPPPRLAPSTFAHVMANPPFHSSYAGTPSPTFSKQAANALPHGVIDLKTWIQFACLMVKPKGTVTFVYPTDHMEDLLLLLHGKVGGLTIYPLWAAENQLAKRVLIRGVKGIHSPTRLLRGLCLHGEDGRYTAEAEGVLRHAHGVVI